MRRRTGYAILALVICLVLTTGVFAMSSTNYRIDWIVPLTGGGGAAESAHYATHLTIGQSVIGQGVSAGSQAGLGFWYGVPEASWELFLPLTIRP